MSKTVTVNGVTITMKTPEEQMKELVDNTNYALRVLHYGKAKSGKSTMASKFPTPKAVIDLDNGALVYKGTAEIYSIGEDSILSKTNPSIAWELADATLTKLVKDPDIRCIVIDSMTSLSDACLKYVMKQAGRPGGQPGFAEWGRQIDLIKEFIFKAFGSGKSVITIWHEETEKDDQTGALWCQPMATGKLSKKAPMWFDEVYHHEVSKKGQDTVYQIRTRASSMYVAGSRLATHIDLPELAPAEWTPIFERLTLLNLQKDLLNKPKVGTK